MIRLAPEAEADLGGGAEERGPGGCVTGAHPAPLPPGAHLLKVLLMYFLLL